MVENWIRVEYGDKCTISFNDCVDIVLDIDDVEFLANKLDGFLLAKCLIKEVCG